MGRPRIYDTPHFCLHTYVRKGHTYVEGYRNEWDPEKKRSRIAQRKYVGVLDTTTGRVRLGKKYLSENPQYEARSFITKTSSLLNEHRKKFRRSWTKEFRALLMTSSATALPLRAGWLLRKAECSMI